MESSKIPVFHRYPIIYKVEMTPSSFDQILQIYCEEILLSTTFSKLEATFVSYVTSIVEPVGWKGVWRPRKETDDQESEGDFVVEVANVSLDTLDADIYIKSVIAPDTAESELEVYRNKFENDCCHTVPLIELYVISEDDEEELYARTAITLEYTRFFYKELLRPWDGEDEDIVYSEKVIKPRLQLYFDMKQNILPKVAISKIKSMLAEGWTISKNLKALYTEMNVSDSESEINAEDVMESVTLRTRLGELQTKMDLLENPAIRAFVMKRYMPRRPIRPKKSVPVTYVVAKEFTNDIVSNLLLEPSAVFEFEHNPELVFKCCSAGDKILIFPGCYTCDNLGWLEGDISVKGIGSSNEIVLEATGNSEVFLNCCASAIQLQNLTLKSANGLLSTVVVHHGKVFMKDCILDSDGAETGLLLLGGAEVIMEDSEVCNSGEDGIQMRPTSCINMNSCKIVSCGGNGIVIDVAEDGTIGEGLTEVIISESLIIDNEGYGIFLNNAPMKEIMLEKPVGDFSILQLFPWIRHQIRSTTMLNNKQPGIGISSTCRPNASTPKISTKALLPQLSPPEELECSALSDLLSEVNMSRVGTRLQYEASA